MDLIPNKLMQEGPLSLLGIPQVWSVDRWGRFVSGLFLLVTLVLAFAVHQAFLGFVALIGLNLLITSLFGHCVVEWWLRRLGAKDREALFFPDGTPRKQTTAGQGD